MITEQQYREAQEIVDAWKSQQPKPSNKTLNRWVTIMIISYAVAIFIVFIYSILNR